MAPPASASASAHSHGTATKPSSPLMSSDEVNLLVYSYLAESSLDHSAFALYNESRLAEFINEDGLNPAAPPTGHLIKILQKGLLYLQAEAKYRGEDCRENPPRLIGYNFPDNLPLPPIPKSLPPPPPLPSPPLPKDGSRLPNGAGGSKKKGAAAGGKDKDKDKDSSNTSNAVAGPSGTTNNKRKEASNLTKDGADAPTSLSKKQKTGTSAGKSPPASTAATGQNGDEDNDGADVPPLSASTSASASGKNKKGKGRASTTDQQGDSEMAEASTPSSGQGQAQASQKEKGPLARAVAAAASATSRALPNAFSAHTNGNSTDPASSSANRPSPPTHPPGSSATNATRRSSSPHVSRTSAGTAAASSASASSSKTGPRSTSPQTSFRSATHSATARKGTSSSDTGSAKADGALPTPTLDASGIPATSQAKTVKAEENLPKMVPKNTIKQDQIISLKGHTMAVQPCHWNPKVEALLATGASDSTMRIWDVPATVPSSLVDPITCKHASGQRRIEVTAVEWNSEGTLLATGSDDGIARIWTPSGDLHLVLSMHQRGIFSVRWNNKGTMLLTGSMDHSICLWESGYGKMKSQWSSHSDSILDLDWMTDEVFASCSMDKNINVHHSSKSSPVYRFKGHSDEVNCIRFDPSKRLLASCSDDCSVRVWSLRPVKGVLGMKTGATAESGGEQEDGSISPKKEEEEEDGNDDSKATEAMCLVLKGHKKEVHAVAWSPKKDAAGQPKVLASASFDSTARLWDANTGACLHIINRHSDMVYSIAFQPIFGEYLATGSNDSVVCITRVRDKELLHEYKHAGSVYEIRWHPTRNQIATCGNTEVVSVVNFELE